MNPLDKIHELILGVQIWLIHFRKWTVQAAENTGKFLSNIRVVERLQYEGEDPLWHPSSWREVTLSTGQSAKVGVMGATRARREAWLEDWERLVLANAQAGLPVGMDGWRPIVPVTTIETRGI